MYNKIVNKSFQYCTEYDYDSLTSCSENGCDDEGICRCSTIENAHIISVNITSMINDIYPSYFDKSLATKRNATINSILGGVSKEIDIYTIDRILRINKVYEPTNWEINVCGGYYGQEIDNIILEDSIARKLEEQIDEALSIIELTTRVEYLLKLEYGHILPSLQNCQYSVETIERDKIIFGNNNHYKKVNLKNIDHYSDNNYNSIRGIVLKKDEEYRLIDGYHRCSSTNNKTIQLIVAI